MATPQVSGDGSLIGFTAHNICLSEDSCTPVQAEGLLAGAQTVDLGPGVLQLSKNGRWALLVPTITQNASTKIIDLQTSQTASILGLVSDGRAIASNGAVLIGQTTDVGTVPGIWK